ncbi:MAG: ATP-grasp domain-containing protein [Deltaproteobacteria bacterium]|nr:MAG: ATP-grasp domain-containing protein [Deltaproteobacteria bacterium]
MNAEPRPLDGVILLFGGTSSERRVSVASAQHLARAFDAADPVPSCWFWDSDGAVVEAHPAELLGMEQPFETEFRTNGERHWPDLPTALDAGARRDGVFLLALHGGAGEDGTVQRWLEDRRLAFTGTGSEASAHAFDKALAQEIVWSHGLRVPESCVIDGRDLFRAGEVLEMLLDRHGKAVLKPVADGSGLGLCIVRDPSDLEKAIDALRASPTVGHLAEAFVDGVELTVGVIDGPDGARALPCSEVRIAPGRAFDFAAKYLGRGAIEITPAEVDPKVARNAQDAALVAHRALGCYGYSRTDLIADESGAVFLETNTLPGLTGASFLPQQLDAADIPLRSFIADQIALARKRR